MESTKDFELWFFNRIKKYQTINIYGTQSRVTLTYILNSLLDSSFQNTTQLIITDTHENAEKLLSDFKIFSSERPCAVLAPFDISPYSGLYANKMMLAQRLNWLYQAQSGPAGQILISSIGALQQKTLPLETFYQASENFHVGSDVPNNLKEFLSLRGYQSSPVVESVGQFSVRGGIVDLFSPAHNLPIRIELFGHTIESIRSFHPEKQLSDAHLTQFNLIPAVETLYNKETLSSLIETLFNHAKNKSIDRNDLYTLSQSLSNCSQFTGIEFLLPYFYEKLPSPLAYLPETVFVWHLGLLDIQSQADHFIEEKKAEALPSQEHSLVPDVSHLFFTLDQLEYPSKSIQIKLSKVELSDLTSDVDNSYHFPTYDVQDFIHLNKRLPPATEKWYQEAQKHILALRNADRFLCFSARNQTQYKRIQLILDKLNFETRLISNDSLSNLIEEQRENPELISILSTDRDGFSESVYIKDSCLTFLRDVDFLGKKQSQMKPRSSTEEFQDIAQKLSFGDLNIGDYIVHTNHGIGIYEGLKIMPINGVEAEFIQLKYKDDDRLYLPIYRISQIQKYKTLSKNLILDKLGGTQWEKSKTKVKKHLRDIAAELLELYAQRKQLKRSPFEFEEKDLLAFENSFPYDETADQLKTINDLYLDLKSNSPTDRLVCGDVGFGKTEVALRAAFVAIQNKKQVAVLAPTTVLTFQHYETFTRRFKNWPIVVRSLSRFTPTSERKETLLELKQGKVDLIVGTHRLLSNDIELLNLGLLIIDEEQRFGVSHKERIKQLKKSVDTITLSATPIPRTLNMSISGIRDLSLIVTPPSERLPTRTFVTQFEPTTIRKAVLSEIERGGQIFFIHNRIQGIYSLYDELKILLPEVKMAVGHGQMKSNQLEQVMISFFKHEIDMLVCTTIIESGMDIPNANTMFIDQAHTFGLSQLYQLRGRVGRSRHRAYCYLLIPKDKKLDADQQQRLKVIQENTALGSGILIAQYDLELRGAGNILGQEQSGYINAVGYELYMELLDEALKESKGEPTDPLALEPDINLRIPSFIPNNYIPDVKTRLVFYKTLSSIRAEEEIDKIEDALRDQFGKPPEEVYNLLGIMLIRFYCKKLGVRDLSGGLKTITLAFTESTPLSSERVVQLAMMTNKKYSITPDNRLKIRMNEISWPRVYEELKFLITKSSLTH